MNKQAERVKLLQRLLIYHVFNFLFLKFKNARKSQVGKIVIKLQFEIDNDKKYQIAKIKENSIYARESNTSNLASLYYLTFLKDYLKNENPRRSE